MVARVDSGNDTASGGPRSGFLFALPPVARERLVREAIRINVPAASELYGDHERPRVIVVVRGTLRVFLTSADGRQVTVRHLRSGDVAGLALALGGPGPMEIQSVTSASVLALRVETLRSLIATDPGVARACAEELAAQLYQALDDLSAQAFGSVRQRVVRQLLELASRDTGPTPVVHASHEELADAVASVRVVVTRTLHQLKDDGLIQISREGIVLRDLTGLAREVADGT